MLLLHSPAFSTFPSGDRGRGGRHGALAPSPYATTTHSVQYPSSDRDFSGQLWTKRLAKRAGPGSLRSRSRVPTAEAKGKMWLELLQGQFLIPDDLVGPLICDLPHLGNSPRPNCSTLQGRTLVQRRHASKHRPFQKRDKKAISNTAFQQTVFDLLNMHHH